MNEPTSDKPLTVAYRMDQFRCAHCGTTFNFNPFLTLRQRLTVQIEHTNSCELNPLRQYVNKLQAELDASAEIIDQLRSEIKTLKRGDK